MVDPRYRFLNAAAERLYRRTSAEVVGQGLLTMFPSIAEAGVFACLIEPLRTGRPSTIQVPSFDENRVAGAFTLVASPCGNGVVVTARDRTGEVAAQVALADSEALLRVVLDTTSDAVIRFGPDQRLEYVNRRTAELSGIPVEAWIGRSLEYDVQNVELDEQAAQLLTMGCPAAQGDLYSPAVPPTEMTALIDTVFACTDSRTSGSLRWWVISDLRRTSSLR